MESTAGSVAFSVASPAGCQSEANTLDVVVCPGTYRQRSTDGERALLTRRTFEIGVAYANEQHARLALHRNQFDDIRRNGGVWFVQTQADHQYFRHARTGGKLRVARLQQRQHGD